MEVLLQTDVEDLGKLGDVVKVANGYARNYLLPKKLAVPVSPDALRAIESARQARIQREQDELTRVTKQARMMEGFLCFIPVRATAAGHLFGSVGGQQVAEHLLQSGFEGIRAANIALSGHIEEVGDYEVEVMLHPEVRTTILVRVAPEEKEGEEG
jgi:large subunit ribosomal protein L9